MGQPLRIAMAAIAGFVALMSVANAQSDPPGRIGRLAYINGPVSFHDEDQTQWAPAIVNRPLTTGDSLWTEHNARSEVSISGTRVRMDGATELDMLAIDDSQVRMQVPQGRLDIKAAAMDRPYEIVTPRGTVALQQPGDYYILAGSTQDPTLLGVRSGAAQITGLNGQTLAVRAGEVGEVSGDSDAPVLRTVQGAPPPMQPYWADRDRQISYDQSQYVPATVTGYEDLNAYGVWSNQGDYGQIWTPRFVPVGWEPYRYGHWVYMQPWGWTWVDEQPWGFAPFHYGRWVNVHRRWSWVPPARETQAVYAPALVSFIGGGAGLLLASRQPSVGWFPLGPREVYVPPYTANRDYFRNVNRASVRDQALIDARYQWAQEHRDAERPPPADPRFTHVNQRFATVVPQQAFQRSQPMERAAIKVAPDKLAAAPIAPVAAPPVVTRNAEPSPRAQNGKQPENRANATPSNGPVARTAFTNMETIGKPAGDEKRTAPGPRIVKRAEATLPVAKPETGPTRANEAPPLSPRTGAAPPPPLPGANKPGEALRRPEAPKPPAATEAKGSKAKGAPVPAEHPALVKPEESKTRPEPPKLPAGDNKTAPDARPAGAKPPLATERTEPPQPPTPAARPEPPKPPAVENKAVPSLKPPPLENKAVPSPQPPARPAESRPADARPAAQPERPAAAPRPAPAPEPPRAAAPPPPRPAPAPAAQAPRPAPPPQQAHAPEPPRQAPPPPAPKPQAAPAPKEEKK